MHLKIFNILLVFLCGLPTQVFAHPEELVRSFLDEKNTERAMPLETDRYGEPLWELNAAVPFVGSPVHEKMTIAAINVSQVHSRAYKVDYDEAYIHGVLWSDDPENLLCPECSLLNLREFQKRWGIEFATRFLNAKKLARSTGENPGKFYTQGNGLLERSHFGDLQFLHGMAVKDGELAKETQKKILKWAEFAYRVATGNITQTLALRQIPIQEIRNLFLGDSQFDRMSIEQLFLGARFTKRVAVGTLLHMIQDSYAPGHADREVLDYVNHNGKFVFSRGKIKEFHSYANQDSKIHADDDTWPAGLETSSPISEENPISVGSKILKFVYANDYSGTDWNEVRLYLEDVVFAIIDGEVPASAGEKYRLR